MHKMDDVVPKVCQPSHCVLRAVRFKLVSGGTMPGVSIVNATVGACAAMPCSSHAAHPPWLPPRSAQGDDPDDKGMLPAFTRMFRLGFTSGNKHEADLFAYAMHKVLLHTSHPITNKGIKKPTETYSGTGGVKFYLNWSGPYVGYSILKGCASARRVALMGSKSWLVCATD